MESDRNDAPLVGRWLLEEWYGTDADGRRVAHGGENPRGELIYSAEGRVSVQISYGDRPTFGSTDLDAGSESERAAAYSTYNAYLGRWSIPEPGVVVHHVEQAIQPDQPGMEKRRPFEIDGDLLTLTTQPVRIPGGGEATSHLRWRRA